MGVSILAGKADGTTDAAALYCNSSGWMVGPIFEAPDAADQAEAFLAWMTSGRWRPHAGSIGIQRAPYLDGDDPRAWADSDLGKLVSYWRANHVGEDGWLLDPYECECGHHHLGPDGELVRAGACEAYAPARGPFPSRTAEPCPCTTWTPANKAAEAAAKED